MKTLLQKENNVDLAFSSFPTSISTLLYPSVQKQYMYVKLGLIQCFNPFPNKPWFLRVCSKSLLKTLWEKEKLLVIFHSVFYLFGDFSAIFNKLDILGCKLFQFESL